MCMAVMSMIRRIKGLINDRSHRFYIVALLTLCVVNLLFMHAYFRLNGLFETWPYAYSGIINLIVVVFDVSILVMFFLLLTIGRLKASILLSFVITLIWSFVNVFYGRFFMQYLPISVIAQVESLTDGIVVDSMLANFKWFDFFYPLSILFFWYLYVSSPKLALTGKSIFVFLATPFICLFLIFLVYTGYHFSHATMRHNMAMYKAGITSALINPAGHKNSFPNESRYHTGTLRILVSEIKDLFVDRELNLSERQSIKKEYQNLTSRVTDHVKNDKIENVIIILLESFMSVSSDLKVDGKEITPFLNKLKHSDSVYYNGHIAPNITIGESGDGQFIYLTGVLPLRSKVTVGEAKNKSFPALPRLLKKYMGVNYSEIVLPTTTLMWQQEGMNKVYGINKAFQNIDMINDRFVQLNDTQIFQLAKNEDKISNKPFFSMVLNVDTHQPYRKPVVDYFTLKDPSLPAPYKNYLIACHHIDNLIKDYFDFLKSHHVYDNSLIVILSDHHAHFDAMGMNGKIAMELPLYIVNGNIDKAEAWNGPCNQLDVFTTILDVLNIKNDWHGLGHTLLSSDYENSVTPQIWDISEMIIEGNYFGD